MQYKIYIDLGTGYAEAFPDFVDKFKLSRKTSVDKIDKYFYRILWGKVQFSNSPYLFAKAANNVYRLFDFIQSDEFSYSTEIKIKLVSTSTTIVGYFGRNDCTFDFDRKIFTVEPATLDEYTALLENWETEVDFSTYTFSDTPVSVEISEEHLKIMADWPYPSITIGGEAYTPRNLIKEKDYDAKGELYVYFDGNKPKSTLYEDTYYMFEGIHRIYTLLDSQTGSFSLADRIDILGEKVTLENRATLPIEYGDFELYKFRIYEGDRMGGLSGSRWRALYCHTWFAREETVLIDVLDPTNPYGYKSPVGEGWNMRNEKIKGGKNAHTWTRLPFNGAYSEAWGTPVGSLNNGISINNGVKWFKYLETSLQYQINTNSIEIVSTIGLKKFIDHLITNSSSELAGMQFKSTFFFNDYEAEVPVLNGTTGYNYVTGAKNYLNDTRVFFTQDIIIPNDELVINRPKYTLMKVISDLNKLFANKLTWFIDGYGNFRLEHVRWPDLVKTPLDLTFSRYLNFTTYWSFDKTTMFEHFDYKQVNAGYPDFTDNTVDYNKIVSNKRNQDLDSLVTTLIFSSDARYAVMNPNDLKDGLIIVAVGPDNKVMNKTGKISNLFETNGFLALSNILLDFLRYEGVWLEGKINGEYNTFSTSERNKVGVEIKVQGILKSLFYTTQIGIGLVDEGTLDFDNENTSLMLRYRYNSSVNGDVFVLAFQKQSDFVGAVNNWADIDNYIITT